MIHTIRSEDRLSRIARALLGLLAMGGALAAQDRALAPGLGFTRDFEIQWPVGDVSVMCQHDDGTGPQLYVGGQFYDVNGQLQFMSRNIARWDGRVWSRVGGGLYWETPEWFDPTEIRSMCVFQGQLYISGGFNRYWSPQQQAWLPCETVFWNGSHYELMPSNPVQWDNVVRVQDMIVFDDGTGEQLYFGATSFNSFVMRWSGTAWSRVGNVQLRPYRFCIHDLGQGPLLFALGGTAFSVNGQSAQGLAAWNGTDWILPVHPLPFTVYLSSHLGMVSITEDGRPSLYVFPMGSARIWRYRDGAWSAVLDVVHTNNPDIERIMAYDDGNGRALFIVGNRITLPGQPAGEYVRFARFDGHTWTPVGTTYTVHPFSSPKLTGVATFDFGEGPDLYIGGDILHPGTQGLIAPWQVMARYRGVYRDLAAVCGGDGSLARCPCDTRGIVGHGCPNSATAHGARLEAQGVPRADTLTFTARDLPPSTLALLFQGDAYAYSPVFAGDGVSCTSGTLLRVGTRQAQGGALQIPLAGEPSIGARVRALGDPLPEGAVRYYQLWYRDPDPSFCASGGLWNTSNGMRVVW